MKCKLSGKKINPFMSFGKMPLANGFLNENEFKTEYFYKMEVGFSEDLSLFQIMSIQNQKKCSIKNILFLLEAQN